MNARIWIDLILYFWFCVVSFQTMLNSKFISLSKKFWLIWVVKSLLKAVARAAEMVQICLINLMGSIAMEITRCSSAGKHNRTNMQPKILHKKWLLFLDSKRFFYKYYIIDFIYNTMYKYYKHDYMLYVL